MYSPHSAYQVLTQNTTVMPHLATWRMSSYTHELRGITAIKIHLTVAVLKLLNDSCPSVFVWLSDIVALSLNHSQWGVTLPSSFKFLTSLGTVPCGSVYRRLPQTLHFTKNHWKALCLCCVCPTRNMCGITFCWTHTSVNGRPAHIRERRAISFMGITTR